MKQRLRLIPFACMLLALISCTGGPSSLAFPNTADPPQAPAVTPANSKGTAHNIIHILLPELLRLPPGAEFDVIINAEFKSELFQGSGRIAYNRQLVEPISAKRGAIPESNVFAAKLDSPPATRTANAGLDGVVPFAFTALPGTAGFGSNNGELLRIRFRLLESPGVQYPVVLINTPEYLQLRDAQGRRLSFDLNTEVTQK